MTEKLILKAFRLAKASESKCTKRIKLKEEESFDDDANQNDLGAENSVISDEEE